MGLGRGLPAPRWASLPVAGRLPLGFPTPDRFRWGPHWREGALSSRLPHVALGLTSSVGAAAKQGPMFHLSLGLPRASAPQRLPSPIRTTEQRPPTAADAPRALPSSPIAESPSQGDGVPSPGQGASHCPTEGHTLQGHEPHRTSLPPSSLSNREAHTPAAAHPRPPSWKVFPKDMYIQGTNAQPRRSSRRQSQDTRQKAPDRGCYSPEAEHEATRAINMRGGRMGVTRACVPGGCGDSPIADYVCQRGMGRRTCWHRGATPH